MPNTVPETPPLFYSFPSPAKLNLFLHVVGQRANGYHELQTIFQFLDHGDTLDIAVVDNPKISLITPIAGVNNDDNLIVKAAKLLQKRAKTDLGAQIKIQKLLPMGGGLGGGSSNAATVLLALNLLWRTNLTNEELAEIGLSLGADVPVFIRGFSAFAQGIGEELTPINPTEDWYLVTKPDCSISTESVFKSKDLPRDTDKLSISDLKLSEIMTHYHNDCQTMVIKHYPEVANLLAWLLEYAPSQMTGTGACIFTRFDSKDEACQLQKKLPMSIESFVAKGQNQSAMVAALEQVKAKFNC